jgi:hypothetical protein
MGVVLPAPPLPPPLLLLLRSSLFLISSIWSAILPAGDLVNSA